MYGRLQYNNIVHREWEGGKERERESDREIKKEYTDFYGKTYLPDFQLWTSARK